jgi:hypothetical protein
VALVGSAASPGVLIHGRFAVGGPLVTLWRLSGGWLGSGPVLLDAGHLKTDPGMAAAVVAGPLRLRWSVRWRPEVLIHGWFAVGGLPVAVWRLSGGWLGSGLVLLDAGH